MLLVFPAYESTEQGCCDTAQSQKVLVLVFNPGERCGVAPASVLARITCCIGTVIHAYRYSVHQYFIGFA